MHNYEETNAVFDAILNLLPIDAGCFRSEYASRKNTENTLYQDLLSYLNHRLKEPNLSAQLVAHAFGISERHVYRLFAERGATFGTYLRDRRLAGTANELMSKQNMLVSDIAYDWGFNDLSTFIRAFKKKFGYTPTELRRRY
jgi:AraC-like DNA-binding protein